MFRVVSILPSIIIGLIFISGLINAINPRFFWEKFESWKAKKEPSKTYFIVRRISGIVAMIVSAIMLFFPQFMGRGF